MKTVADPRVLDSLVARLQAVQPDGLRRWGTLTAHEMLCHLGDATGMVLRTRPRTKPVPAVEIGRLDGAARRAKLDPWPAIHDCWALS